MTVQIDTIQRKATEQLDQNKRSEFGQFLTPSAIAKFMASLFSKDDDKDTFLLDAGAGVGSLTTAFLDRKLHGWGSSKKITVRAYEIDILLISYLKENLAVYRNLLLHSGMNLNNEFLHTDFIYDAVSRIKANEPGIFTHAILNPPYKKINSSSDHRQLLSSIGFETVNLYPAFVALALLLLHDGGELVAIIPRSFCNGNYYKAFRHLITKHASIKQIHLFDSRNQAFKEDDVLQENIIIHLIKNEPQGEVKISHSTDDRLLDLTENSYSYNQIVKPEDTESFIHIPNPGANHIEASSKIIYSLSDLAIQVSTGPVVDFRVKEFLHKLPTHGTAPLLYPNHFNGKDIDWPKESKKPNAIEINMHTKGQLYPSGFYTVVRRFSSKEEKQRITARVINPNHLKSEFIGIENHLNVFHFGKKGIDENLAYGLSAYLNSSFVDTHFRSFNGHTQVNATDLRQMKYPSREALIALGRWAKKAKDFHTENIDERVKMIL